MLVVCVVSSQKSATSLSLQNVLMSCKQNPYVRHEEGEKHNAFVMQKIDLCFYDVKTFVFHIITKCQLVFYIMHTKNDRRFLHIKKNALKETTFVFYTTTTSFKFEYNHKLNLELEIENRQQNSIIPSMCVQFVFLALSNDGFAPPVRPRH